MPKFKEIHFHESQPFLQVDEPERCDICVETTRLHRPQYYIIVKCAGRIFCSLLAILLIALVLFLILIIVYAMSHPCLQLLPRDSSILPFNVGVDIQSSKVFIIFSKPLETERMLNHVAANLCDKYLRNLDTTATLAILRTISASSLKMIFRSHSCVTPYEAMALGEREINEGRLRIYLADGANETEVVVDRTKLRHLSDNSVNVWLSSVLRGNCSKIAIDFTSETTISVSPAVAVDYSNFQAFKTAKLAILPINSNNNPCGCPALSVALEESLFSFAKRAFDHWRSDSFAPLSQYGAVSNYIAPSHVYFSNVTIQAGDGLVNRTLVAIKSQNASLTINNFAFCEAARFGGGDPRISLNFSEVEFNVIASQIHGWVGNIQVDTFMGGQLATYNNEGLVITGGEPLLAKFQFQDVKVASGEEHDSSVDHSFVETSRLEVDFKHLYLLIADDRMEGRIGVSININEIAFNDKVGQKSRQKATFVGRIGDVTLATVFESRLFLSPGHETYTFYVAPYELGRLLLRRTNLAVGTEAAGRLVDCPFFEAKLTSAARIVSYGRDLSLTLFDLNMIEDGSNNSTKLAAQPFKLTILDQQKMPPVPAAVISFYRIGNLTAQAVFDVEGQHELQDLGLKLNRVTASLYSPTIQTQPVEVPQLSFHFNGTDFALQTSLALQISLKELTTIVGKK